MIWTLGRPVSLTTERFTVRSLRPEDVNERYASWWGEPEDIASTPEAVQYPALDDHRQRIADRYDNRKRFHIGIFDRKTDTILGFISVFFNDFHRTAKVNFLIGDRDYWGQDLPREIAEKGFEFLFEALWAEKVSGHVTARNFEAVHIAKVLGMSVEGILKKQVLRTDDSRADVIVFGLLREDWRRRKERQTS